jgi:uracil-DNA glycosylase family 4
MTVDRDILSRYLRQLAELGGAQLYLESLMPREALEALRPSASGKVSASIPLRARESTVQYAATATAAAVTGAVRPATQDGERTLRILEQEAAACTRCRLHEGRRTVVFGEGNPTADMVVVGEAPGQEEDRTGRPFVGRAGKMLDLLLLTAGFPRQDVFICNVLKCRPPNNRDPLPDEVAACTSLFLRPQLQAIGPRVLLAVGKFAAQSLLRSDESIARLRGRVHSYDGTPLVVTYHPAFLLRTPQMTRTAWDDFQLMRKVFDEQT